MANISDSEHAMIKYANTFEEYRKQRLTLESFTDGWIFITMLRACTNFKMKYGEFIEQCTKWTFKLSNLKKLINLIEEYFEEQIKKTIKTKDIDLVEIAKNHNILEILKLFELVVATLTEAPNKQDHINTIMSLDERSQATFVSIIQNILQTRILDKKDITQSKQDKMIETVHYLQMENGLLRNQVVCLLNQNQHLEKEIQQLKHKQADYEEELHKIRDQEIDKTRVLHEEPKQKQHLRNMIENLKEKLISTVRENQIKVSGLKEEINILQAKSLRFEEMEDELQDYKRKYAETIESYGQAKLWEREKSKLTRTIEQKQEIIKKLNAKLDEANELNYAMQEREVYTKMEIERRDVRFKQLEKEVKKKNIHIYTEGSENSGSSKTIPTAALTQQINQIHRQQVEELKSEIDLLRKKNRQFERENNKLKRNLQKYSNIENDKKKLQRLILDVNNEKRVQFQVLLSTTYDFYAQNQRLRELLAKNNVVC